MILAKKAFHKRETAPRGARMTTGREAIWTREPKTLEEMKMAKPPSQRGRLYSMDWRSGGRAWLRTWLLRWMVRPRDWTQQATSPTVMPSAMLAMSESRVPGAGHSAMDLTDRAQQSLADALQLAREHANPQIHPPHIAFVLLDHAPHAAPPLLASIVATAGGDPHALKRAVNKLIVRLPSQSPPPDDIGMSTTALKVLRDAQNIQKSMHDSYIAQDHLILALLKDPSISSVLNDLGLTEHAIKSAVEQVRGNRRVDSKSAEAGFDALQKYAIDLTALAEEGKIDPVIGRDNEIRRLIRILCRRQGNPSYLPPAPC